MNDDVKSGELTPSTPNIPKMTENSFAWIKAPGCIFVSLSFASVLVGLTGGVFLGLLAGIGPEHTGGTLYWMCGSILVGLGSVVARLFTKRRVVLYGVSFFFWLTVILLIISVAAGGK